MEVEVEAIQEARQVQGRRRRILREYQAEQQHREEARRQHREEARQQHQGQQEQEREGLLVGLLGASVQSDPAGEAWPPYQQ